MGIILVLRNDENINKYGYINTWFYGYIRYIGKYFNKNIMEIIQNSWKYLENFQKMIK